MRRLDQGGFWWRAISFFGEAVINSYAVTGAQSWKSGEVGLALCLLVDHLPLQMSPVSPYLILLKWALVGEGEPGLLTS